MELRKHRVEHKGTVYELTIADDDGEDWYLLFATRESHDGDWVRLPRFGDRLIRFMVGWDYLTEKCPGLARYPGDKSGWIMVCKEAGIEVFG